MRNLKRFNLVFMFVIGVTSVALAEDFPEPLQFLFGNWEVVGSPKYPGTYAMEDTDAEKVIGRIFTYTAAFASYSGESCDQPVYSLAYTDSGRFYQDYRFLPEEFNLPEPVLRIDISCDGPFVQRDARALGVSILVQNHSTIFGVLPRFHGRL